jgi:hypothetical protein
MSLVRARSIDVVSGADRPMNSASLSQRPQRGDERLWQMTAAVTSTGIGRWSGATLAGKFIFRSGRS